MRSIPVKWVHEKLRIPEPEGDEPTLGGLPPEPPQPDKKVGAGDTAALAALAALKATVDAPDEFDTLSDDMASDWERVTGPLVNPIERLMDECKSLEEFKARLPQVIDRMDTEALASLIASGSFAAHLLGRAVGGSATG
jgi:phage gp29-like protein